MDISLVIPAYNEEKRIQKTLDTILAFNKENKIFSEIIVINDGSTDSTLQILKNYKDIKIITYLINKGKGEALRQGVLKAKSDWVYICDADLSTPIEQIHKFIKLQNDFNCIIGSRGLDKSMEKRGKLRSLTGKFGNFIIDFFLDLGIKDTQCGFKLFDKKAKEIFQTIQISRWGYDFEFLYKCKQKGLKIQEIPVSWQAEDNFSKVTTKSYFQTFWELFKFWKKNVGLNWKFIKSIFVRYNEFVRYIAVGTITNVINLLVFYILIKILPEINLDLRFFNLREYHIADTINYLLTIVTLNFLLHKYWTFKSKKMDAGEFGRYLIILILNHIAALGILTFFIELVNTSFLVAKLISLLFIISWNFFVLKLFVYKKK